MSAPPPPIPVIAGPMNPVEVFFSSFNTNPQFIGIMMTLLNLGGRHLALGLSAEQDKFFQNAWVRRFLIFVVLFVATRNFFAAFWMSILLILLIGHLLNEHSPLQMFGPPVPEPKAAAPPPPTTSLTPEEQEIQKRLHDKVQRSQAESSKNEGEREEGKEAEENHTNTQENNLKQIQQFFF